MKFVYSPYADYLYYLFYRSKKWFSLDSVLPLDSLPTIQSLTTFPEMVASSDIKDYGDIYKLFEVYRDTSGLPHPVLLSHDTLPIPFDTIQYLLKAGEKYFPSFRKFWKSNIKPLEERVIELWKKHLKECRVFESLQKLERLPFPFDSIYIGCIALHLSASGIPYPPGIFSMSFDKEGTAPDLAWVVGHEATHIVVGGYGGEDWKLHPLAREAISLVRNNGGSSYHIEEALTLFMQVKLSQECGFADKNLKISDYLDDPVIKKICRGFETYWEEYKSHPEKYPTIIDFMLKTTIKVLIR